MIDQQVILKPSLYNYNSYTFCINWVKFWKKIIDMVGY